MSDEKLDQILRDTSAIKVDLQALRTTIRPDENEPNLFSQHHKRLEKIEKWQNRINGGSAVLGFLWTALAALLGIHVSKH